MRQESSDLHSIFNKAVISVIDGNESELKQLLKAYPNLIYQRSGAPHKASLLHYIAANGVEDELQRSPENANSIAQILLNAGAEVDALAECYGGGSAQTPLSLLVSSYHPAKAGVQVPLVESLLEHGAKADGIDDTCGPIATAIAFGYLPAAKALANAGARIDCLQIAAALGDLTQLSAFFDENDKLLTNAGIHHSGVITSADNEQQTLSVAFWYACLHNQIEIAKRLLSKGADVNYKDKEGFAALHSASVRGNNELVTFLLDNQANTEVTNDYGGTPLDTLCWFATNNQSTDVDYVNVAKLLLDGEAQALAISPYPTGHNVLDELLKSYR